MYHRQNTLDSTGSFRIYVQKRQSGPWLSTMPWRRVGEWMYEYIYIYIYIYISMNYRPSNWLDVSDTLNDSAALPSRKSPWCTLDKGVWGASEPVWTTVRGDKSSFYRDSSSDPLGAFPGSSRCTDCAIPAFGYDKDNGTVYHLLTFSTMLLSAMWQKRFGFKGVCSWTPPHFKWQPETVSITHVSVVSSPLILPCDKDALLQVSEVHLESSVLQNEMC
jgi:hypothetical protein